MSECEHEVIACGNGSLPRVANSPSAPLRIAVPVKMTRRPEMRMTKKTTNARYTQKMVRSWKVLSRSLKMLIPIPMLVTAGERGREREREGEREREREGKRGRERERERLID